MVVIFPLSVDLLLVGMFDGHDCTANANIVDVAELNSIIIGFAERQVYAADLDFPYLRQEGPMPLARGEELVADGSFVRPRPEDEDS